MRVRFRSGSLSSLWAFAVLAVLASTMAGCDAGEGGPGAAGELDAGSFVADGGGDGIDAGATPAPVAPAFTAEPADQSVAEGATATLTVAVNGEPTPSVSWQTSSDGVAFTDVPGATGLAYTTPPLTLASSGLRVRAVATNGAGSKTSAAAKVTVTPKAVTVARIAFASPTTVVREDATGATPLPAPDGAVSVIAYSPAGRIILAQASASPNIPTLVSMRPDGTDRVVLLDASAAPADTLSLIVVAVAPNDTVYYRLLRGASQDVYLGSVKSDGTSAVAPIQLSGGATGVTGVVFHGTVPFNDPFLASRYTLRIFTNDSRLAFSESLPDGTIRVRATTPALAPPTTALVGTVGAYDGVCGITPDGRAVYTRFRSPGPYASIVDAFAVNLDGSGKTQLNAAATTNVYSCNVTVSGKIIVRTRDATNLFDVHLATAGVLVPLAATTDDELFQGETADGRLVYSASDPATGHMSLHVVDAAGANKKTLTPKTDAAGPYGGFIGVTPAGRLLFARSTSFGGNSSTHSVLLDGTSRVDLLGPTDLFQSWEPFGVTATGHLVYRGLSLGSTRLISLRTDALLPSGQPDKTILVGDPTAQLRLILD